MVGGQHSSVRSLDRTLDPELLDQHVRDVRAQAEVAEHEWDRKALQWKLPKNCTIIDVGGFRGRWSLQMAQRYESATIHLFEPQIWAADVAMTVLRQHSGVHVYHYGLSSRTRSKVVGLVGTDGASSLRSEGPFQECEFRNISEVFQELGLMGNVAHVMMVNIEGEEYDLLPYMLKSGITPKAVMTQFHMYADPNGGRMAEVEEAFEQAGYRIAWDYGVVLRSWVKK